MSGVASHLEKLLYVKVEIAHVCVAEVPFPQVNIKKVDSGSKPM